MTFVRRLNPHHSYVIGQEPTFKGSYGKVGVLPYTKDLEKRVYPKEEIKKIVQSNLEKRK